MHQKGKDCTMAEKMADITVKLLSALIVFMLTCLLTLNVTLMRSTMAKATDNEKNIAVMGEQYKYIVKALDDIKEK